jgi:septal ring factor EnvC (AmiA/AmiB activator)
MTTPSERAELLRLYGLRQGERKQPGKDDQYLRLIYDREEDKPSEDLKRLIGLSVQMAPDLAREVDALTAELAAMRAATADATRRMAEILSNARVIGERLDALTAERDRLRAVIAAEISGAERCAAGAVDSLDTPTQEWFARKAERLKRALGEA